MCRSLLAWPPPSLLPWLPARAASQHPQAARILPPFCVDAVQLQRVVGAARRRLRSAERGVQVRLLLRVAGWKPSSAGVSRRHRLLRARASTLHSLQAASYCPCTRPASHPPHAAGWGCSALGSTHVQPVHTCAASPPFLTAGWRCSTPSGTTRMLSSWRARGRCWAPGRRCCWLRSRAGEEEPVATFPKSADCCCCLLQRQPLGTAGEGKPHCLPPCARLVPGLCSAGEQTPPPLVLGFPLPSGDSRCAAAACQETFFLCGAPCPRLTGYEAGTSVLPCRWVLPMSLGVQPELLPMSLRVHPASSAASSRWLTRRFASSPPLALQIRPAGSSSGGRLAHRAGAAGGGGVPAGAGRGECRAGRGRVAGGCSSGWGKRSLPRPPPYVALLSMLSFLNSLMTIPHVNQSLEHPSC